MYSLQLPAAAWSWPRASSPSYPQRRSCLCSRTSPTESTSCSSKTGYPLRSVVPDTCPPVLINRAQNSSGLSRVLLIAHAAIQSRGHRRADCLFFPQCGSNRGAKFESVHRPDERGSKPQYGRCRGQHAKPASDLLLEPAAVQRANRAAEGAVRVLVLKLNRIEIRGSTGK